MRVGGSRTLTLDVRIISATNASLETMIDKREFRADLFYRLNEYVIYLPPLRERVKDLPLLVDYFCQFFAEENNVSKPEMPAELLQRMMQYHWPGNVRELKSLMQAYVIRKDPQIIERALQNTVAIQQPAPVKADRLEELEVEAILAALAKTHWNQKKAASQLGISYSTIRRKIQKYDLMNTESGHSKLSM